MYLVFPDDKSASIALEQINKKMDLPDKFTQTWVAGIHGMNNEKVQVWFFKSPPVDFLEGIENYRFQADVSAWRESPQIKPPIRSEEEKTNYNY